MTSRTSRAVLQFLNKYFYLHAPMTEEDPEDIEMVVYMRFCAQLDTSLSQDQKNKLYEEYVRIVTNILDMCSKLGSWSLTAISSKAHDYSNLKQFQKKLSEQFKMYSLLQAWMTHYGFSSAHFLNRSFASINQYFEKLVEIVKQCYLEQITDANYSLFTFQQFLTSQDNTPPGVTIGDKLWKQLSGPVNVYFVTPNLKQNPTFPTFMLLGDYHGGYGDCDQPDENILSPSFLYALNSIGSTHAPVDVSHENYDKDSIENTAMDFEITGGKNAVQQIKDAKTSQNDTLIDFVRHNIACFLRNQKDNQVLKEHNVHCRYDNIRFHFADPRQMQSLEYTMEFCLHAFMDFFLDHHDSHRLINDFVYSMRVFEEPTYFFHFLSAFEGFILSSFEPRSSILEGMQRSIYLWFHDPLCERLSILRKYQTRGYTLMNKTVEQTFIELFTFYYNHHKEALNNITHENIYQANKTLSKFFSYLKRGLYESPSFNVDMNEVEDELFNNQELYHMMEIIFLTVQPPALDTYFLFRSFKLTESRPLDYETEARIPWLQVLYAGDTHCEAIYDFLKKFYKDAVKCSIKESKNHCVEFTNAINLNKIRAMHETVRMLSK